MKRWLTPGAIALSLVLLLSACDRKPDAIYQQQILALGTLVDVVIYGVDEETGQQAVGRVNDILEHIHHDWHAWEPSKLTQINQRLAKGESATLDAAGQRLISKSIALSLESGNLFNPATGKLIAAWGFHSDERDDSPPPADEKIRALLAAHPRMSDLVLEGNTLRSTNPEVQLDLGGFAKGYAVDLAIAELKKMGISNAIVNAGGDLRAIGNKNGIPWRIGIRHPREAGIIASLNVEGDESVFTSGDYERYFDYHGQRYHHIIDPRTGRPAKGTSSVTVIHQDAATADAAATALLIAGPAQWQKTAQAMGVNQVMLIDLEGNIYMSERMAKRLYLMAEPTPNIEIVKLP